MKLGWQLLYGDLHHNTQDGHIIIIIPVGQMKISNKLHITQVGVSTLDSEHCACSIDKSDGNCNFNVPVQGKTKFDALLNYKRSWPTHFYFRQQKSG